MIAETAEHRDLRCREFCNTKLFFTALFRIIPSLFSLTRSFSRPSWLLLCLLSLALDSYLSRSALLKPCLVDIMSTRLSFVGITTQISFLFLKFAKMTFLSSPVRITLIRPSASQSPRVCKYSDVINQFSGLDGLPKLPRMRRRTRSPSGCLGKAMTTRLVNITIY